MSTDKPLYPNIKVKLVGEDGNAFNIIGTVIRALERNGVRRSEIDKFWDEAMCSDYDNLLRTCMKYVDVN